MHHVAAIEDPAAAEASLDPIRVRLLAELVEPGSASTLAALGIDSEVRFSSAKDRAEFARELAEAVNGLVAKYHDEGALGGRPHRFVVALHPTITKKEESKS